MLASQYGAGPRKIQETLELAGMPLSLDEVCEICSDYWRLFAEVKRFGYRLEQEWQSTGGWVRNGSGRPLAIDEQYKKDCVSRVIQSTGHDFLQRYIWHIACMIQERGLKTWPWIVDIHDETQWECRIEDADKIVQVFKDAMTTLNAELGGEIKLTGEPMVAKNLAEIKCEG